MTFWQRYVVYVKHIVGMQELASALKYEGSRFWEFVKDTLYRTREGAIIFFLMFLWLLIFLTFPVSCLLIAAFSDKKIAERLKREQDRKKGEKK